MGMGRKEGRKRPGATWFLSFFFRDFIYLFLERRREGEREGEKHQCVVASSTPPAGDLAQTQACALTGNRTRDLLVRSLALSPLSHTSQGTT